MTKSGVLICNFKLFLGEGDQFVASRKCRGLQTIQDSLQRVCDLWLRAPCDREPGFCDQEKNEQGNVGALPF